MNQNNPFKWRHYQGEIILLNVRWYLRYPLSYRDLEALKPLKALLYRGYGYCGQLRCAFGNAYFINF